MLDRFYGCGGSMSLAEDRSVDLVTSNCVIYLSPDKRAVFREMWRILKDNGRAGFYGLGILKKQFWREVEGYDFYSVTVRGFKFHKTAGCVFKGHRAVYLGPYASVVDEEGHHFPRGQEVEVCTDTVAKLTNPPYRGAFLLLEPGSDRANTEGVSCAPGCC